VPITSVLIALTVLLGSLVTTINLDDDADLEPLGIVVNEHREMLLDDGRTLRAGLGCHGEGDIRYYRRSPALFLADEARYYPQKAFADRLRDAHAAYVETEVHELFHAAHCLATGATTIAPTPDQAHAIFDAVGLNPEEWKPRPATYREAYTILTALDRGAWGDVGYCWSNEAEWFACLATAVAGSDRSAARAQERTDDGERPYDGEWVQTGPTSGYWGVR